MSRKKMKNELDNIQVLRAIAALMVVTNHFLSNTVQGVFKHNGGLGVDIFFVISGFLMVYTQNESKTAWDFFISRVKRIYPLYIIVSIPLIITTFPLWQLNYIAGNFLLSPGFGSKDYHMANSPAWTLVYEMLFYIMFSISLLIRKDKISACVIVCLMIVIVNSMAGQYPRLGWVDFGYIIGDKLMLDFAAGCIIAVIFSKIEFKISFFAGLLLTLIIIGVSLYYLTPYERLYRFGAPAILIVCISLISYSGSGLVYSMFHKIGDSSYSIYLSHTYILYLYESFSDKNNNDTSINVYASIVFMAASIAIGIFISNNIEKPIQKYLKKTN